MSIRLTEDQILQLAPDAASVKAGQGQAKTSKWPLLRCSDRALWGHCQGSGSSPYQTIVDLTNIAFKCSCPSHKFPCKHSLGLLLLYARNEGSFTQEEEPDWVTSWIDKRAEAAEKKAQREERKKENEQPKDPKQAARRLANRHAKILAGIEELELWMKDLLRTGLMHVASSQRGSIHEMARRMVDAQAPGLAQRLYEIYEIDYDTEGWKELLTERLSRLYLLLSAYRRIDTLSEDWQTELRTMVGIPQSQDEVLAGEGIEDDWFVLHRETREVGDNQTEATYLYGVRSDRITVRLSFIVPGRPSGELTLMVGKVYHAKAFPYKGRLNRRVLVQDVQIVDKDVIIHYHDSIEDAMVDYRDQMCCNPFIRYVPLLIHEVRLAPEGDTFALYDMRGRRQPVSVSREHGLHFLTLTGGKPCGAFIIADEGEWQLISIDYDGSYYTI